jgi:hypothetical protein
MSSGTGFRQYCKSIRRAGEATVTDIDMVGDTAMTAKPRHSVVLPCLAAAGAAVLMPVAPRPAYAVDEIQLYNAEIAEIGQWTVEQHLNYTFNGRREPDFPGGFAPNHSLNGTPEFAYGMTDWWELGFYIPWAVDGNGQLLSNGVKLRTLFVTPNAAEKSFFYGINFEFDFQTPKFAPTLFGMEIRPILGWRNPQWEFIVNPIFDLSFGSTGLIDFVPAARLARNLGNDVFVGVEYYGDLGQPGSFANPNQQEHQLFAVTDFKVGKFDIDLGLGYGLTPGSDRLVAKAIVGYAFPVPGKDEGSGDHATRAPLTMRSTMRQTSSAQMLSDPFSGMR